MVAFHSLLSLLSIKIRIFEPSPDSIFNLRFSIFRTEPNAMKTKAGSLWRLAAAREWNFLAITGAMAIVHLFAPACCRSQGTLTLAFEGQPRGTMRQLGAYIDTDFGVRISAGGPGVMYLSVGGVSGYPDNGTGYLYMGAVVLGTVSLSFTSHAHPRRYLTTASVREWTCSFSYTVRT